MNEQHHTEVRPIYSMHEYKKWRAYCSCGWLGRVRDTDDEAEHDATDHVAAVPAEPTVVWGG